MAKRCVACGGARGRHTPDCEKIAVISADPHRKHAETEADIVERVKLRRKRKGWRSPKARRLRTTARHMAASRLRRGWTLDDKGDFVPPLPEPVGRFDPMVAAVELIPGSMGSRYRLVYACASGD